MGEWVKKIVCAKMAPDQSDVYTAGLPSLCVLYSLCRHHDTSP